MVRFTSLLSGALFLGAVASGCGGGGGGSGGSSSASTIAASTSGTTSSTSSSTTGGVTPGTTGTSNVTALPLPTGAVGGPRARGIDVSRWQNAVDWAAVKRSGISFGIARVSDGLNTRDVQFAANWAGIKAQGLVRGTYQFFRASQDPVAQADLLVDAVNAAGGFGPGDLPPLLDLEVTDGMSAATVKARADAWIARVVARTGLRPPIYTSPAFWASLGARAYGDDNALWIAHWGVSRPTIPSGWQTWTFWQDSATGRVPGVTGDVDTNLFNGGVADLRAYAGAPSAGFFRGIAPDSTGRGYTTLGVTGGLFCHGDATFRGTAGGQSYPAPFVAMTRTPTGLGQWLVRTDGELLGFGDAVELGDLSGRTLAAPVFGIASTRSGRGYWLFTRDGRVHAFGDAQAYGEPAAALRGPAVAAASTRTGLGYFVAEADGTVHGFGDAVALAAPQGLTSPVVGLAVTPTGLGYWLALADGAVLALGDAPALTYTGARTLRADVVAIAPTTSGRGYWLLDTSGVVQAVGDAVDGGARPR